MIEPDELDPAHTGGRRAGPLKQVHWFDTWVAFFGTSKASNPWQSTPQAPRALGFCLFGSLKAQGNRLKIHISAAQADTQMGLQVSGQIQSRAALLGAFEEFHSLIGDRDERP